MRRWFQHADRRLQLVLQAELETKILFGGHTNSDHTNSRAMNLVAPAGSKYHDTRHNLISPGVGSPLPSAAAGSRLPQSLFVQTGIPARSDDVSDLVAPRLDQTLRVDRLRASRTGAGERPQH